MNLAVYVRVSTSQQAQTQTIEHQLTRLAAYCRMHHWPPIHIFRDDGYSGASLRRPGLDAVRDQAAHGASRTCS
jgi:site-specific DNA recombinase